VDPGWNWLLTEKNIILHEDLLNPNLCHACVHTQLNTGNKNCFGEKKKKKQFMWPNHIWSSRVSSSIKLRVPPRHFSWCRSLEIFLFIVETAHLQRTSSLAGGWCAIFVRKAAVALLLASHQHYLLHCLSLRQQRDRKETWVNRTCLTSTASISAFSA
jgi:hypothetical protein